jgi:hypothetical protein
MHSRYAKLQSADAIARIGVEAGTTFDKNSALPMTIYTLPLAATPASASAA